MSRCIPTPCPLAATAPQVRISVSNLDLDVLNLAPGATKEQAMDKVRDMVAESVAPKFDMDLDMIWGTDGKEMRLQVGACPGVAPAMISRRG